MTQPIWNTPAGSIGSFPALIPISFQLSATPVAPATEVTYKIISGSLPNGLTLSESGLISGTPPLVIRGTSQEFVVRVTDNEKNIRDRTFSVEVSGSARPEILTPPGLLLSTEDSTWVEIPIDFFNPDESSEVRIRLVQGQLPPGLEINRHGVIRGYPRPPVSTINLGLSTTTALATNSNTNRITALSTANFRNGRPVVFTGAVFGGVTAGQTYYIRDFNENTFTISTTIGGPVFNLQDGAGEMIVTLPAVSVGQPAVQTFPFSLRLESELGTDLQSYSIQVINQRAPQSIGGPGKPRNTRQPTIYNTRPPTFDIDSDVLNFSYYILPPDGKGQTIPIEEDAFIGRISSDNFFSFRILGHDFDSNALEYVFSDLPLGLVGDTETGWVTGTPIISDNSISEFSFNVSVQKEINNAISSPTIRFTFRITDTVTGDIEWITPNKLEEMLNGTVSLANVQAKSDVELQYRLVGGSLPPNLQLLSNGEITGRTAFQPSDGLLEPGEVKTFEFTVEAFSPQFPVANKKRTFTLDVKNVYSEPTETLYIKCNPNLEDRKLLDSLLKDSSLIPDEYIYRPGDPNFGKATGVVYEHAFGIFASEVEEYVAAITKNHYWRKITLGEIETAVARDSNGEIIYEVVYSKVIDNLVNPEGVSVSKRINWPRFIDLAGGPWYTSATNIFTSYGEVNGVPTYFTSLSPGFARLLYPNSLENMRNQVSEELGQEFNFRVLPKWMTSQQRDGSTLGYTPAWVIAYTKPGFSEKVKENIVNNWVDVLGDRFTLNAINFTIDRFTVDKSATYDFDKNVSPPAWLGLPSAQPTPDPKETNDFHVLFPQKTILPSDSQFNK